MDRGDGDLAGLVGSAALYGNGDDLACLLVGTGAHTLLALAQDLGLLLDAVGAHAVNELLVGVLARERGDALELDGLTLEGLVKLLGTAVNVTRELGELGLARVERVIAAVKGLLALHDPALELAQLALALLLLCRGGLTLLEDLLLGLQEALLLGALGLADGLVSLGLGLGLDGFGALLCARDLLVRLAQTRAVARGEDEVRDDGAGDDANHAEHNCHAVHVCS